jgi:hypothetical protein
MRIKITLIVAAIVALAMAATAFAGPINELEKGKDWWYLIVNKAGDRTGYMHDTYARIDFQGQPALKMTRVTVDRAANRTEEIEYIRQLAAPLLSLTVKVNGNVVVTAKPVPGGWEFTRNGEKQPVIEKGHFEDFSCDELGIYSDAEGAKVGGPGKTLRIYDVVGAARFERIYKNLGTKEGKIEFDVTEGAKLMKVHVSKETMTLIDSRVEGAGLSIKRTSHDEVKKYFPDAQ